jgi:hypothetical protein
MSFRIVFLEGQQLHVVPQNYNNLRLVPGFFYNLGLNNLFLRPVMELVDMMVSQTIAGTAYGFESRRGEEISCLDVKRTKINQWFLFTI